MMRTRWHVIALSALILGIYLPDLNSDYLVGLLNGHTPVDLNPAHAVSRTRWVLIGIAVVIGLIAAARWWLAKDWTSRRRGLVFLGAAGALLAAVYLPDLRFDDLVVWLWGTTAEAPDRADAVTWARWALVAIAVALLAFRRFTLRLEVGLLVIALLVVVAGVRATGDLFASLEEPKEVEKTEPAFDRGFALPLTKFSPSLEIWHATAA